MDGNACCVTGHRDIPAYKLEQVKEQLYEEVKKAIEDGYTTFISGFNNSVDLLFAEIVTHFQEKNPHLHLEAAIPFSTRLKNSDQTFQRLLAACRVVNIHQEKYTPSCYLNRNRQMIASSDRLIALYDGRESGHTLFTMRYAHIQKKEVRVIPLP